MPPSSPTSRTREVPSSGKHPFAPHGPTDEEALFLHLALARGLSADQVAGLGRVPADRAELAALPAEVLGQVHLRALQRRNRKAGGVFYTPPWVGDRLVAGAVGPLLSGRTPEEVAGLRVLDPACGCGALLLAAYRALLDWYLVAYRTLGGPGERTVRGADGVTRLAVAERARILAAHLRGVELDGAAAEVCRRTLLLALLDDVPDPDGRDEAVRVAWAALAHHVVPGDILGQAPGAGEQVEAVIGNPPYLRRQALVQAGRDAIAGWRTRYRAAGAGNWDQYVLFVERCLELLAPAGRLALVLPHRWLTLDYGAALRELLAEGRHVEQVVHFGARQLFDGATTYTCLLQATRRPTPSVTWVRVDDVEAYRRDGAGDERGDVGWEHLGRGPWNPRLGREQGLIEALAAAGPPLEQVCERVYQGLATSADPVYVLELVEDRGAIVVVRSRALGRTLELEGRWLRPMLFGADVARYREPAPKARVLFPYHPRGDRTAPATWAELEETPRTAAYLLARREALGARAKVAERWWLYPFPKNLARFSRPKILSRVLAPHATFGLDPRGGVCFAGGGTAGGNAIAVAGDDPTALRFLLGVLNSPVTTFWVRTRGSAFQGGHHAYGKASLRGLPVPNADACARARVAELVARRVAGPAANLEREIDERILDLYGLDPAQREWLRNAAE